MKIIAHDLNHKPYKGFLGSLSLLNDVSVWNKNIKSIFDMQAEMEPDLIIIPQSVVDSDEILSALTVSSDAEFRHLYVVDENEIPMCANLFKRGKYNEDYASDILILASNPEDIYNFSFLLYPNQNKFKVKLISQVPFPVAEYIGFDKLGVISDYIESTKLVICNDEQTEMNMLAKPNIYPVLAKDLTLSEVDHIFDYYGNEKYGFFADKTAKLNRIKNGLTYHHIAKQFYDNMAGMWYKDIEVFKEQSLKMKEIINESWNSY